MALKAILVANIITYIFLGEFFYRTYKLNRSKVYVEDY